MSDADIRALREEIERLQRRVDELSDRHPQRRRGPASDAMPRRGMLRTVGAAAAGVAVGSLAFAKPAGAADGNRSPSATQLRRLNRRPHSFETRSANSAAPSVGVFHVTDNIAQTSVGLSSCRAFRRSPPAPTVPRSAFVGAGSAYGAKLDGRSSSAVSAQADGQHQQRRTNVGSRLAGEFKVVNGDLWFCAKTANSNDAIWRRLSGVAVAGGFVAINPARAYDSRLAAYTANGALAPNTNRVISVKDAHNGAGGVTTPNVVPAGATAVTFNLTVTGTTEANFITVAPGDAASFTASTVNWTAAGVTVANGGVCKLDASRQLKIFMGDQPGSANFIVDITGYYL